MIVRKVVSPLACAPPPLLGSLAFQPSPALLSPAFRERPVTSLPQLTLQSNASPLVLYSEISRESLTLVDCIFILLTPYRRYSIRE